MQWTSHSNSKAWRFQFLLHEIRESSSHLDVVFCHALRSANSLTDGLDKQGVDREAP